MSSQKGGISTTTTEANLAVSGGAMKRRVVAIDFYPKFALVRRFRIASARR